MGKATRLVSPGQVMPNWQHHRPRQPPRPMGTRRQNVPSTLSKFGGRADIEEMGTGLPGAAEGAGSQTLARTPLEKPSERARQVKLLRAPPRV